MPFSWLSVLFDSPGFPLSLSLSLSLSLPFSWLSVSLDSPGFPSSLSLPFSWPSVLLDSPGFPSSLSLPFSWPSLLLDSPGFPSSLSSRSPESFSSPVFCSGFASSLSEFSVLPPSSCFCPGFSTVSPLLWVSSYFPVSRSSLILSELPVLLPAYIFHSRLALSLTWLSVLFSVPAADIEIIEKTRIKMIQVNLLFLPYVPLYIPIFFFNYYTP